MQVIATAPGYDNVKVREVDEVFEMPDGATGDWFTPLEVVKAQAATHKLGKKKAVEPHPADDSALA